MKPGSMRDWLRPILGVALLLGGAAGVAYKVISGYRHASPDAFFSVEDQNRLSVASAADHSTQATTVPVAVPAPQQTAADAQTAPMTAAAPPIATAPAVVPGNAVASASSAAADADLSAEAQDSSECAAAKSEQHEIRGALNKQYSPEEGRYMQRRLRELAEQLVMLKCAE
jgi:hypothetical protein